MFRKISLIMIASTLTLVAFDAQQKTELRAKRTLKLSSIVNAYISSKNAKRHSINLAGKQRMLTQKMMKLAVMRTLDIDSEKSKQALLQTAKLYDTTLKGFLAGDNTLALKRVTDPKVISFIKQLQKEWEIFYKDIALLDTKSTHISSLIEKNTKLLSDSDRLVKLLKRYGTKSNFMEKSRENIIDIAGRERMLLEKMTKEKLLVTKGIQVEKNRKSQKATMQLFDDSLRALREGDSKLHIAKAHNQKILTQLDKVDTLWHELRGAYLKDDSSKKTLSDLVAKAERLRDEMNRAVHLYETIADY